MPSLPSKATIKWGIDASSSYWLQPWAWCRSSVFSSIDSRAPHPHSWPPPYIQTPSTVPSWKEMWFQARLGMRLWSRCPRNIFTLVLTPLLGPSLGEQPGKYFTPPWRNSRTNPAQMKSPLWHHICICSPVYIPGIALVELCASSFYC